MRGANSFPLDRLISEQGLKESSADVVKNKHLKCNGLPGNRCMPGVTWSRLVAVLTAALVFSFLSIPADAQIRFDLPAQSLAQALTSVGNLANLNIYFDPSLVDGRNAPPLKADLNVDEALTRLLAGTRLHAVRVDENTVRVVADPAETHAQTTRDPNTGALSVPSGVHLAYLGAASDAADGASLAESADSGQGSGNQKSSNGPIDQVIVTAQKREQRLQDVPVPVTAVDTSALAQVGQNRIQDYYETVPSLNVNAGDSGQQSLSIRGITTGGGTNPTVGVTIDEVPYGSSTIFGLGNLLFPDIDPSDLARVEILRGPQGTLYGASSIGGLINFVTLDPSTSEFGGRVQVLGSDVENGGLGYGARAAVNVPLSDTVALRASGFTRRDPGYVDNVTTGESDVNRVDVYGGRLSGLWRPSEDLSLKLSALLQTTIGDGTAAVDTDGTLQVPVYGDLKQARMPGTEGYSEKTGFYTAILKAKFANMSFASISGYGTSRYSQIADSTYSLGSLAQSGIPGSGFNGFGVSGASEGNRFDTNKFSQELRLSSMNGHVLDWLLGAFYTHENTPADQNYIANNPTTGAPVGVMINFDEPSTLTEYALYGDLTVHLTDRFDVQFGGRESKNKQTYNETDSGPLVPGFGEGPSPYVQPTERTEGNAFTYLVTPQFKVSPELMIYARLASGYRVGGLNLEAQLFGVPSEYKPDTTNNYEVGIKGDLFDRKLTVDASAYYIDWRHIQIYLENPLTLAAYYQNGGTAKSEGLELSLQARPARGLTIAAVAAVDNAELTQDLPSAGGAVGFAGDSLPFTSRFSGSLSVNQDILITGQWTGFFGGTLSYVGEREGPFAVSFTEPRFRYPAYTKADFRLGVRNGAWTTDLFVNNAFDRRGIVGGGISYAESPYSVFYIQPLTVGLSLTRTF
jgi:iron complex outermembrane receptor protein